MNKRFGTDELLGILNQLWPKGIPNLDYRNALRIIRLLEEIGDEAQATHGLSSAQDR